MLKTRKRAKPGAGAVPVQFVLMNPKNRKSVTVRNGILKPYDMTRLGISDRKEVAKMGVKVKR